MLTNFFWTIFYSHVLKELCLLYFARSAIYPESTVQLWAGETQRGRRPLRVNIGCLGGCSPTIIPSRQVSSDWNLSHALLSAQSFSKWSYWSVVSRRRSMCAPTTTPMTVFHIHTFPAKLISLHLNIPGRENILNYSAIARFASGNNNKLMYYWRRTRMANMEVPFW